MSMPELHKGDRFDTEFERGCEVWVPPNAPGSPWGAGEFQAFDPDGVLYLYHTGMITRMHPRDLEPAELAEQVVELIREARRLLDGDDPEALRAFQARKALLLARIDRS